MTRPTRVVVTGGSGFIGRALLAHANWPTAVVYVSQHRERLPLLSARTFPWALGQTLPAELPMEDATLIHLADTAHTFGVPEQQRLAHVDASRILFEQAVAAGARRIVLVSSCKAGYERGKAGDVDAPEATLTAYGRAKRAQENALWAAVAGSQTAAVVLRPALVYGPGVKGSLGAWLARAMGKRMPPLPKTKTSRSMVHVDDLARVIAAVAMSDVADGGTFYVTDLQDWRLPQMDAAIRAALGQAPRMSVPAWLWRAAGFAGSVALRAGVNIGVDTQRVSALIANATYDGEPIWRLLQQRPQHDFVRALPAMLSFLRES